MTEEVLVFEITWNDGVVDLNGYRLKEAFSFDDFQNLKMVLLEPFLDEQMYRIEEFTASRFNRVSVLRVFPESFEVEGFRPISFVTELPVKAKNQHCLMITIPQSVEEALQLKENDEMIWSEYAENKVTIEIRRRE